MKTGVKPLKKKSIKKVSKKTPVSHHLQPILAILGAIQSSERKVTKLLDTTALKLEKLVPSAKQSVVKATNQQKKAAESLKTVQLKHAKKPSRPTSIALKRAETLHVALTQRVQTLNDEHAALEAQLATCKDMRKSLKVTQKTAEIPLKKSTGKKSAPQSIKKSPNTLKTTVID